MSKYPQLKLAYFGDDFTGSTDAMDMLSRAGIRTALFFSVPDSELLGAFPDIEVLGIAGTTRSLAPTAMEEQLRPAFAFFKELAPPHVHYKVCSTFDSSPEIGSIGHAIEVADDYFPAPFTLLLVGAPDLGRYCLFGNLFARMGTGPTGPVHRIDRHPSMSRHPVTPATESDLRIHLGQQTDRPTLLFDVLHCRMDRAQARAALNELVASEEHPIVLFDSLEADDLRIPGYLMEQQSAGNSTLFSVGSSAVETALIMEWGKEADVAGSPAVNTLAIESPILVVSGSCSPVTREQIRTACDNGFSEVVLDIRAIMEDRAMEAVEAAADAANKALRAGRSVIVHTQNEKQTVTGESTTALGTCLGKVALRVSTDSPVERIVVAGGDTSGQAAAAMGIQAVTTSQPFFRGAPFCRIHAPGSPLEGREINFKGGQVGTPDYFIKAATHPIINES